MYLQNKYVIKRPVGEVYELVRDHLEKIVPYLPNIEKIEVIDYQKESDSRTKVINRWYGKAEIPTVAKKFVKKEFFSWKDTAVWKNDEHCVEYDLESYVANDLFDAKGKNYFRSLSENETEFELTCEVEINPSKVPGVPKFLVKKVLPILEDMIKRMLTPNLTMLGEGITKYYEEHKQ